MATTTHVDNVTANLDGTISFTLTTWMNPTVAATFAGATVAGTATDAGGGAVKLVISVTPGSPIVQQTIQSDAASSNST